MVRKLSEFPPHDLDARPAGEILKLAKKLAGWSNSEIGHGVSPTGAKVDVNENTVKGWINRNALPQDSGRIREFLFDHSSSREIAEAWWTLLDAAWKRQAIIRAEAKRSKLPLKSLVARLQARVLADVTLTRLPALFETDQSLPLAHAYVELRLAYARAAPPAPRMLELRPTLAERLQKRAEERASARRSPKEALDDAQSRRRLILGAPGSGKSSLLRRIAIDIASGTWKTAKIPFFLELRSYARMRRERPTLTLVDCACERLAFVGCDREAIRSLLMGSAALPDPQGVLLVDGLDEIASDSELVQSVYHELANQTCAWIVTSRPAGLMQALHEGQRLEMVGLDREAIEALITNWCTADDQAERKIDPVELLRELDRVPGMREMASNPFLLTALCFLKATAPGEALPNSRIAVYETLQQRIALQAQRRYSDSSILAPEVLGALSAFACFLYERPRGVLQIFNRTDWLDFSQARRCTDIDFERQVLRSRLLTVWHEADPHYHFLHLTLQEHLIAQELLSWTVEQALRHRFAPAWRSVFRFYGALLWHRQQDEAFERLTNALYLEKDVNNFSIVALAEIFADAGIRDTTPIIGADLRKEIFGCFKDADDSGLEALLDALSILDPDWMTDAVLSQKDADLRSIFEQGAESVAEFEVAYDGQQYSVFGRCLSCSYLHLGRARTPRAISAISEAFWGVDQSHALMAAHAYAETASQSERERVVAAGLKATMWSEMAQRIFAFAVESRSALFVPFLKRVIDHFAPEGNEPFSEALSLLADIGGEDAAEVLQSRLLTELRRHRRDNHQIESCARAVVRLGGRAIPILENAIQQVRSPTWRRFLEFKRIAASPAVDAPILAALDDIDLQEEAIGALADAACFGRLPSEEVMSALDRIARLGFADQVFNFALIEQRWLEIGRPPCLSAALLSTLEALLQSRADGDQPSGEAYTRMIARQVFETLGKAKWGPARSLIEKIIDSPKSDPEILEAAAEAAGLLLADTADERMLQSLENLLYGNTRCDLLPLTLAIGRIDLERLFRQQSARTAGIALQQISAERDLMIFEAFWADRNGKIARWRCPPSKVFHIVNVANRGLSEIFAHEMSRWGMQFECEDLSGCQAALIFEPATCDGLAMLVNEAEALAAAQPQFQVFPIRAGISDRQAKTMARRIGATLGRNEGRAPQLRHFS